MAEDLKLSQAELARQLVTWCTRPAETSELRADTFPEIARLAKTEGLAPLLGARLAAGEIAAPADSASETLSQDLQQSYRHAARVGAARSLGAEVLQRALAQRRIPALLLKGAALVATIYRDPGRRTMGDIDLLVPPERWQDALNAARKAGARTVEAPRRPVSLRHFHEVHLVLPGGGVGDLHRRLAPWPLFTPDLDRLFQRSRPAPADAEREHVGSAQLPAPEDLLLSLVVHCAKDGFQLPLRAVVDGLRLLAVAAPDPHIVADRARGWHARRATARWLQVLDAFGELGAEWRSLPERLAPQLGPLPPGFLQPPPGDPQALSARWAMRRRQTQALDARWRALAYGASTALFFLGDLLEGKRHRASTQPATKD